jgi:hypothetical protein
LRSLWRLSCWDDLSVCGGIWRVVAGDQLAPKQLADGGFRQTTRRAGLKLARPAVDQAARPGAAHAEPRQEELAASQDLRIRADGVKSCQGFSGRGGAQVVERGRASFGVAWVRGVKVAQDVA